jgi:hypothetical protein
LDWVNRGFSKRVSGVSYYRAFQRREIRKISGGRRQEQERAGDALCAPGSRLRGKFLCVLDYQAPTIFCLLSVFTVVGQSPGVRREISP